MNIVSNAINVTVNGAARALAPGTSVAALIEAMQLVGKRVAVERNGEIVPRSRYAAQQLNNGDTLEIVAAVGGG